MSCSNRFKFFSTAAFLTPQNDSDADMAPKFHSLNARIWIWALLLFPRNRSKFVFLTTKKLSSLIFGIVDDDVLTISWSVWFCEWPGSVPKFRRALSFSVRRSLRIYSGDFYPLDGSNFCFKIPERDNLIPGYRWRQVPARFKIVKWISFVSFTGLRVSK